MPAGATSGHCRCSGASYTVLVRPVHRAAARQRAIGRAPCRRQAFRTQPAPSVSAEPADGVDAEKLNVQEFRIRQGQEEDIWLQLGEWAWQDDEAAASLYEQAGWPASAVQTSMLALQRSPLVGTLLARSSRGTTLVGMARITTDGHFHATISELVMHPAYQGKGLAQLLVKHIINCLLQNGIENCIVFSDADAVPFYKSVGFDVTKDGIKAMLYRGRGK